MQNKHAGAWEANQYPVEKMKSRTEDGWIKIERLRWRVGTSLKMFFWNSSSSFTVCRRFSASTLLSISSWSCLLASAKLPSNWEGRREGGKGGRGEGEREMFFNGCISKKSNQAQGVICAALFQLFFEETTCTSWLWPVGGAGPQLYLCQSLGKLHW